MAEHGKTMPTNSCSQPRSAKCSTLRAFQWHFRERLDEITVRIPGKRSELSKDLSRPMQTMHRMLTLNLFCTHQFLFTQICKIPLIFFGTTSNWYKSKATWWLMRLRPSHRFALKADPYSGTAQHGTAKHSCTNLESDIHTSTYFKCMVFWEQNTSSDAHVRPATHLIKCTFTAWISWLHCQSFAPTISIGKAVQKTSEDHKKLLSYIAHWGRGHLPCVPTIKRRVRLNAWNDPSTCRHCSGKYPGGQLHPLFGLLGLWVINVAAFHLKFDLYCNHLRTFNQMNIWQSDGNIRFYQVPILDLPMPYLWLNVTFHLNKEIIWIDLVKP